MAPTVCSACGSTNLEDDNNAGNTVCTDCGLVVSENAIVSEVGFQETGTGGASIIGHFVGNDQAHKSNLGGLQSLAGAESREVTLEAGKKRLQMVASQLRINQHCVDMAFSFFKMAVARGMTKGRRALHVTAACLYITCRTEGTAHMLLDFSDVCQVNVYDLGRCVSFLSRSLYINLPVMDPCIYVMRYAHSLKFGEKEALVCKMACRLVKRMKLDWMAIGRRPSGICGAALLLAARYHNFNRTLADIVRVVNIGEAVIRKRLDEFAKTPSSALTLDEFPEVDLEQCDDPPAFKEAKLKVQVEAEERVADELQKDLLATEQQLQPLLTTPTNKSRYASYAKEPERCESPSACSVASAAAALVCGLDVDADIDVDTQAILHKELQEAMLDIPPIACTSGVEESSAGDCDVMQLPTEPTPAMKLQALRPTLQSLGIKPADGTNQRDDLKESEDKDEGHLDLDGISDDEIDSYILSERESKLKSRMWHAVNGGFMKQMEERRRFLEEQAEKDKNDPNKKKSKPRVKRKNLPVAASHEEAIQRVIKDRKLSSKINYDVLRSLKTEPPIGGKAESESAVAESTDLPECSQPVSSQPASSPSQPTSQAPASPVSKTISPPQSTGKLKRPARQKKQSPEEIAKQEKAAAFGRKRTNRPNLGAKRPRMVMSHELVPKLSANNS